MAFLEFDHELMTGGRTFIPGHYTFKDHLLYIKITLHKWWFRLIGKYKIVDSTKYTIEPYPRKYYTFRLSVHETEFVKSLKWRSIKYEFYPTPIGNGVYIVNLDTNERIDLTEKFNYEDW